MSFRGILTFLVLCGIFHSFQNSYVSGVLTNKSDVVCENNVAQLNCEPNQNILEAPSNYGGTLKEACPYPKSKDPSYTDNDQCLVVGTSHIQELCRGKQNCQFRVTNEFFGGDPCPGTYKYLSLSYICRDNMP